MKLYLSSYRIPVAEDLIGLVGRAPQVTKVALIPNAKDYYAERARAVKIRDVTDYFNGLGFKSDVVDLRQFDEAAELKKTLDDYDLIWAMGGNTFCLRYEMHRSGFEKVITELLAAGKVYGGESAGALVAGNDLHGVEFADEPEFAEAVIWEGLHLIDHFVLPHVGSPDYGQAIDQARAFHKDDKTTIELSDFEALIVEDGRQRIVSAT